TLDGSTGQVTGTGTHFTTELAVGDWLMNNSQQFRVEQINSDTSLAGAGYNGSYSWPFFTSNKSWADDGTCGWVWVMKHHPFSALSDATDYPVANGAEAYGAS